MMAYNFLFFYPLTVLSIILSIIVGFRLRHFRKEVISKILLFISILPSTILTVVILVNLIRISNAPEILDLEIPNNTVNIKVNDSLEIKLHGFTKRTMGTNDSIIEQKIVNLIPYVDGKYRFKDGGKFSGIFENQEIFYNVIRDSLVIFNFQNEYQYFNKKRIALPFEVKPLRTQNITEEKLEKLGFKKFEWK